MRVLSCLLALALLLAACSQRRRGPMPADYYDRYKDRFRAAEELEKKGERFKAILAYIEAKEALEDLRAAFPRSQYFDERELARVKDIIQHLKDEERRGVEAVIAGQEGPPPVPEPEMSGEFYHSVRRGIEGVIGKLTGTEGKQTNDGLDRVKRVEPDVVDNTPALVIHILTNSQLIEGMMVHQVKLEMKEVLKVIRVHERDLDPYKIYVLSGFKAISGAGGYAEPVLLVEYRFTPEDFQKIDWDRLDDDETDISEFATATKEP